jgi:hypothetical protein
MAAPEVRLRVAVDRIIKTWSMIKLVPEGQLTNARVQVTAALRENLSLSEDDLVVIGLKHLYNLDGQQADDPSERPPSFKRLPTSRREIDQDSSMPPKPPALASKPIFEPALETVRFEFWMGNLRQAGLIKVPNMTAEAALDYFMMNWARIGSLAAKTPPTSGVVRLKFNDPALK